MSYSIQCVHCKAVLKSPAPVPAGKNVKCPKCKQTFTTPGEGHSTKVENTTSLQSLPAAPKPELGDDDMEAAIAKLQTEQAGGKKPAPPPSPAPKKPAPKPTQLSPSADEDDEMAAAVAKLEAEQSAGKKPVPAPPRPNPPKTVPDMEISDVTESENLADEDDDGDPTEVIEVDVTDEVDDDEPPAKKKRRADEEDEDEEPRAKKKRRARADEEEEDDEEPRSKKRRRAGDDEDEPRSKGKKKKKQSSTMLWILLGGGAVALLLCCGCGIGGYFIFGGGPGAAPNILGGPNIVGKWREDLGLIQVPWEFRSNGTGEKWPGPTYFKYRQSGGLLTIDWTGIEGVNAPGMDRPFIEGRQTLRVRVTLDGDTMRWEETDTGRVRTFRKVK